MAKQKTEETAATPKESTPVIDTPAPLQNGAKPNDQGKPQEPAVKEENVHLIVFKLGEEHYAIKIEQVKEVTITPSITRMPRTPDFVQGVANIRGDIIAIVDLEKRFGIRPAPVTEGLNPNVTYTLVIEAKEYSIGIVVKEVPQSLNLAMSKIDKTPSFLQDTNIKDNYIEGIAKVDSKLIIVLDMFRILSSDEIKQLTGK
ncbi:chemotaxis protein CheW [Pontibacter cellulosilyticus]|uniref:Purine-binding chemotaxis protein CheW n=1 Tax=Pontibacter cellulosilyticus TaxID=1720253 RepID=A0A923SHM6_9BACT|nr:chemotaxis protein CheW [Pontibacter cellulosilyticus]MBC5991853.1 purine-binding chemotaxis protein CheW [Pontibacter cellulosilyticus]